MDLKNVNIDKDFINNLFEFITDMTKIYLDMNGNQSQAKLKHNLNKLNNFMIKENFSVGEGVVLLFSAILTKFTDYLMFIKNKDSNNFYYN